MVNWTDWFRRRGDVKPPLTGRRRIDLGPAPPKYPIYVIGDVHGCINELKHAEARILEDMTASQRVGLVLLLGDYIDRGPDSYQVIEHLIKPSALGLRRLPLCGNHDDLFLRVLDEPDLYFEWLRLGGEQTLMSYGLDPEYIQSQRRTRQFKLGELLNDSVPPSHRHFLRMLPVCLKIGNMVFVHAGIMPGVAIEAQEENDMLWIREPFLSEGPKLPLLVVHGHTPATDVDLGPNRIGIDTGAYYTGKLAVLKIDAGKAAVL